ncbi:regulatory protein RecX [Dethiosulfovibrio salsuginis]|uniref:Regulatory protein RecX n=1 Tax=Dethiosulfovibrio salsuginis TaxID=561720 RepID=A0A1X7J1C7_9BACT|nr:regulatory protein RecX [Dethiosulfovibrio salsuginis]SMG21131.1 regulatory protein [Dethiosulfovibrio salsuginis]
MEEHESYLQKLLSRGAYTKGDLRRKLKARGCPSDFADGLLDRYEELGLIDDQVYAVLFVDSHPDWSIRRISDSLREKGVSRDFIAYALEEGEIDEDQRAAELVRGWRPSVEDRRIVGRLERRGFPRSVIFRAVRALP